MEKTPIQPSHRLLRFCIRMMLPVFALAGFGSLASFFVINQPYEKSVIQLDSPTHVYRVSVVRVEGVGRCHGWGGLNVRVERHFGLLRTGDDTPFCLQGEGSIDLHWMGPDILAINCRGCSGYDMVDEDWEGLHYQFDVDQP